MLFHEIYGCYYQAVAEILAVAVRGELSEKAMKELCDGRAFSESFLAIIPALKNGQWPLLHADLTTPLKNPPTMPLTLLELRWLKAVTLDKRMKLFAVHFDFLEDVEPLFTPADYLAFDQYADGDPYEEETYIEIFRTVLGAIKNGKKIAVEYNSAKGTHRRITCDPIKLEYSEKDDKFRVRIASCRFSSTLNLAGIEKCTVIGEAKNAPPPKVQPHETFFLCELTDQRKALERFLLHFAHFKKEAWQLEPQRYRIKIYYDQDDETELLIRILSFGPHVKVTEPQRFVNLIKERLILQKSCKLR